VKKILRKRNIDKLLKVKEQLETEGPKSLSQAYMLAALKRRFPTPGGKTQNTIE
jgi:hypothetical protein